jgi:hypothetical protein
MYNNGYYIPVFEDDTPLTERKYVLAVKFNGQICGYRMFEYASLGYYGSCWKYSGAELNEDNKFVANDLFEAICFKFGDDGKVYAFENILELDGIRSNYSEDEEYDNITF